MANTVSLSIDLSLTDAAVLNDDSVFSNPIRPGVGVFVTAYKVNTGSQQTEIVIEGDSGSPTTDSKWNFDIGTDGWYQFYYTAIPNYDTGVPYAQYDCVYDTVTETVYQSLTNGNLGNAVTNVLFWVVLDEPTLLVEEIGQPAQALNVDMAIYQRILTPHIDKLYGDRAVAIARECCSDCEVEEHVDAFEIVFSLREGALISEERYEFADGERMVRRLDEFIV